VRETSLTTPPRAHIFAGGEVDGEGRVHIETQARPPRPEEEEEDELRRSGGGSSRERRSAR